MSHPGFDGDAEGKLGSLCAVLKQAARKALAARGLRIVRLDDWQHEVVMLAVSLGTADFPPEWAQVVERVAPYTLTTPERVGGLVAAIEHVVKNEIPGTFVECGVWRGGSSMAAALTFQRLSDLRDLYLFDTFEGMPEPSDPDIDLHGVPASEWWDAEKQRQGAIGSGATFDDVTKAMRSTGYPAERVHLVRGLVEATIPAQAPMQIAVLRLDTDFYESTRHELEYLWPRVSPGGVLIIDDYGHLKGAQQAVDEYFGNRVFLHRLDYSGRLVVKPPATGG